MNLSGIAGILILVLVVLGWLALLWLDNDKVRLAQWIVSGLVALGGLVFFILFAVATDKSSAGYSPHKAENSGGLFLFSMVFLLTGAYMMGSLVMAKVIRWIYRYFSGNPPT